MPLFTFDKFRGDELWRGAFHHFLVEPRDQLVIELAVAKQKSRFEPGPKGGAGAPGKSGEAGKAGGAGKVFVIQD